MVYYKVKLLYDPATSLEENTMDGNAFKAE